MRRELVVLFGLAAAATFLWFARGWIVDAFPHSWLFQTGGRFDDSFRLVRGAWRIPTAAVTWSVLLGGILGLSRAPRGRLAVARCAAIAAFAVSLHVITLVSHCEGPDPIERELRFAIWEALDAFFELALCATLLVGTSAWVRRGRAADAAGRKPSRAHLATACVVLTAGVLHAGANAFFNRESWVRNIGPDARYVARGVELPTGPMLQRDAPFDAHADPRISPGTMTGWGFPPLDVIRITTKGIVLEGQARFPMPKSDDDPLWDRIGAALRRPRFWLPAERWDHVTGSIHLEMDRDVVWRRLLPLFRRLRGIDRPICFGTMIVLAGLPQPERAVLGREHAWMMIELPIERPYAYDAARDAPPPARSLDLARLPASTTVQDVHDRMLRALAPRRPLRVGFDLDAPRAPSECGSGE